VPRSPPLKQTTDPDGLRSSFKYDYYLTIVSKLSCDVILDNNDRYCSAF